MEAGQRRCNIGCTQHVGTVWGPLQVTTEATVVNAGLANLSVLESPGNLRLAKLPCDSRQVR